MSGQASDRELVHDRVLAGGWMITRVGVRYNNDETGLWRLRRGKHDALVTFDWQDRITGGLVLDGDTVTRNKRRVLLAYLDQST
jgi:hypothetical protein